MNKEKKFYSMLVDTTLKYLFKNSITRKILENIIKEITDIDLSGYILVDNELNSGNNIKDYRLDILLKKDNHIVSIECNTNYNKNHNIIDNKNHSYFYRLAGSSYLEGENYTNKYYVTQINFNDGYCPINKGVGISVNEFVDRENNIVVEGVKSYEIYLENYKNVCYNGLNKKEAYLSFLTTKSYEEMIKVANNNEELMILESEIERLNQDEYFGGLYDARIVQKKLENSARLVGYDEGLLEGKKENSIAIAKLMLQKNMNINLISELTNLSIEEINNLINGE